MVAARGDSGAAREAFEKAGFEAGVAVGGTFAITAPRELFEQVFRTSLQVEDEAGVTVVQSPASDRYVLPLDGLPDELRRQVVVATFSPPPAFGPRDY